jgi:hypothetical protein
MYLKKNFPYVVAGYIIAVGVFFCISTLFEGALIDPEPPGSHFLLVFSIFSIGAGTYSIYLLNRGRLEESGKSTAEVRQESTEKLKDPALLAQIATEDQNPEVRKTAEKRLEDLNN